MRRAQSEPLYVSRNHLEGSLCDTPLDRVLAACRKHLVTGVVRVHTRGKDGVIELRAGAVDRAHLGDTAGDAALRVMCSTHDGFYEVAQRLPDLTGDLETSSMLQGDVEGVPLIALMRHCEDNALTCTITVVSGFDRACIEYRAGDIARVELNGFYDDDALPQVLTWPDARFRVAAPPLDLDVEGWPVTRRAPTIPHFVGHEVSGEILARRPRATPPPATSTISVDPSPTSSLADAVLAHASSASLPPAVPARARRYETGDTVQTRRAPRRRPRDRTPASSSTAADIAWIVVAAALLLTLGITSLLWMN